jgi:hypothetical protein
MSPYALKARELRLAHGRTQQKTALAIGLDRSYLNRVETWRRHERCRSFDSPCPRHFGLGRSSSRTDFTARSRG